MCFFFFTSCSTYYNIFHNGGILSEKKWQIYLFLSSYNCNTEIFTFNASRRYTRMSSDLTKKISKSKMSPEWAVLVPVLYYYYYYYYHHQKCGAQFSFPVLFCRFIPQSLMLTLPSYDPSRYKWKSLGLLVCTQNFLSGFFT